LLNRQTASKIIAAHCSTFQEAEVERRTRTTNSLGLRVFTRIAQSPVESISILVAGVASIAIIINAVFLQSGAGISEHEPLFPKLQRTRESLKSESERLRHNIDSASAAIKIMETHPGSGRRY
jgi:hypothetical protein